MQMSSIQSIQNQFQLLVIGKIGPGKFSVEKVYFPHLNTYYALKTFPPQNRIQHEQEYHFISRLSHPNIIKYFPINPSYAPLVILTEFAEYGDLLDMTNEGILNSEPLIRTYFHQLINGLEYMHSKGIAHLDLKLENLVMASGFTLKIIDFDQAQNINDQKIRSCGTQGFRAPEVINGTCRNFRAADIYSAGVILYALVARDYPFVDDLKEGIPIGAMDYGVFMRDKEKYWKIKAKALQNRSQLLFSDDFKTLINGMLEFDVKKRFTLEDVKKSKWYNDSILDEESLRTTMEDQLRSSNNL